MIGEYFDKKCIKDNIDGYITKMSLPINIWQLSYC